MSYSPRQVAHDAARAHANALREHTGTDYHSSFLKLLDLMRTTYMHDLVHISAEDLARKQGALQQVMALTRALSGDRVDTPFI